MDKVSLRNVWKIYPGAKTTAPAVRDFNLDIGDGEFMVFVGASGCGKTTTLRMIAGLESISKGEILIDGKVVNNLSPRQRNIAMVFQNYALYPNLSLFENMAFGLRLRKMEKYKINELVNQKAKKLEIDHLLDRLPKDVSGGQRQRVALGRAIVRDPSVFLMDEPLSNLDAKMRVQMRSEIIRLHRELGTTTVYVTHDQTEAMTMGDRIVVMNGGIMQQVGTPEEIYNEPANRYVAGFIGTPPMNFVPAILARQGDRYGVVLGRTLIPLNGEKNRALAAIGREQGPVLLGLRPEKLLLCDSEANGAIPARVEVAELLGSQVQLHGRLDRDEVVLSLSTLDLNASPKALFPPGAAFAFTIAGEDCHLFDPETERNLLLEG
jgi:multiple sugar transport system ATP-binding protein